MAGHTTDVIILLILWIAVAGVIIGALGRLAIPGPNPMSLGMTALVGIGGSLIGGVVGALLFHRAGGLILSVLGAALIVWLMQRRTART
jgi:uncharacterized membrane protein YeaQ/YmgE (transglycosylase-associated protein family)